MEGEPTHHPPKLLLDSLDLPAGHWQEWWSMWLGPNLWKGRVTSPQTAGPTGASVFFSGFGRFPLVPELGDNYPKSGSFFLNTWTLSWICFVFNLMVLKALKTRLDPPVHQWWMILFRLQLYVSSYWHHIDCIQPMSHSLTTICTIVICTYILFVFNHIYNHIAHWGLCSNIHSNNHIYMQSLLDVQYSTPPDCRRWHLNSPRGVDDEASVVGRCLS